ncbi:hypothetical protein IF2G_10822 [Cordyceps javanica]|nr:hypothetical protein IF2G_10822 [Cordyceps javanica]
MQPIGPPDYALVLVVWAFGAAYLGFGLAIYYSPKRERHALLNDGTSFLKYKIIIYLLLTSLLMISFFIAYGGTRNQPLTFWLYNAWRLSIGLCCHLSIQINPFKEGCSSFLIAGIYVLLAVAVLVPGFRSYVVTERQWLWLFMSAQAALTLAISLSHGSDREYSKHVYFLLVILVIIIGTGLAATIVAVEKAPALQRIQYACQSTFTLAALCAARLTSLINIQNNSKANREWASLPRQPLSAGNSRSRLHCDHTTCLGLCSRSGSAHELERTTTHASSSPARAVTLV